MKKGKNKQVCISVITFFNFLMASSMGSDEGCNLPQNEAMFS